MRSALSLFFSAACLSLLFSPSPVASAATVGLNIQAFQPGLTNPVCVRAIIKQADGTYLDGEWLNPTYPLITMHGKAMTPTTVVQVPAGVTQITVGKGPDYVPQTITTNLAVAGSTYTIQVMLQPAVDLYDRGWRTAEMHLHYIHGEGEIIRAPQDAWAICAAGGLNFVLFCEEHYGAGTLARQQMFDLWQPYANSECQLGMGVEEPKNAWGHHANILYDPWSIRSSLPYFWGIHSVHEQGGVSYPVHPERTFPSRYYDDPATGFRTWFLYPDNNFSKCYPMDALIGHLIDGWSGVSDEPNTGVVLPPYFKLLSQGYRIPLLADSDFCMDRTNNGDKATGLWMTYYYLNGEPLTRAAVAEAMRKGRTMSTTGPLVLFTIDNAMPGDTLPADGATRTIRIQACYTFNPWTLTNSNFAGTDITRITAIDLFRNGQLIHTWTPNTPTASVQQTINETAPGSYYMVRVQGNESIWMAGYASPIYFDNAPRPRQPDAFKPLIQGRLYDAANGLALTGTVSCVRYGKTDWTIPTDSQGRFQVYAPLDAQLVAQDGAGRTFSQNIIQYEPAYAFCHYLADNYSTNQGASIDAFKSLVQQMRWEFPLGYQYAASYVRTNLGSDAVMTNFSVISAPPFTPGKTNSEIVMLLVDKTQVQPGDTINYAAIFRSPQNPPTDILSVEWKGWNPQYPSMYNKYGQSFQINDGASFLINLGNGFYLRQYSVVVPSWATNVSPTTAGIQMFVTVRPNGSVAEDASLMLRIGPTQRGLLVSTPWDGLPASWSEIGIGPASFRREWTDFQVRYSDYRTMAVNLTLNGQPISLSPATDTAHVADADDAVFYEQFYYDGQCEPQYRNVPFRDAVRAQPPATDFSTVPIQNPPDTTPPSVVAIQPADGTAVPAGNTLFYYLIDDAGLSGPAGATIFIDGVAVTNTTSSPIALNLSAGPHTWQVKGFDIAGNSALSAVNTLTATNTTTSSDSIPPSISMTAPASNALLSGPAITVSANATDNVSVASVQFLLDGANLGTPSVAPPYSVTWDTTAAANGLHLLSAIAWDSSGNQSTAAAVTVTVSNALNQNVVWVDDTLPKGAVPGADGGDAWTWIGSSPTPFSGALASQSDIGTGEHQHFFAFASATLNVNTGDVLYAYIYLDPANLPSEAMLQWFSTSWEHRAYWGANHVSFGTDGTPSRRFMGALPAAGQWVRLSVPASQVGLEGSTVNGMAFTLYGGRATWDYAGKFSTGTAPPLPVALAASFSNGVFQVQFLSGGSSYLYTLLRTTNFQSWTAILPSAAGNGTNLILQDPNPSATQSFYQVRAQAQ